MSRDAFPLDWPGDWPRTEPEKRAAARFKASSFGRDRDWIIRQVRQLGGVNIVITSDLPVRADGLPYARAAEPGDPGIAVWWRAKDGSEQVIACDRWRSYRDNAHAVALSLEALRGLDRWGSSEIVQRAFKGFAALPPAGHDWRSVFPGCRTLDEVKLLFRRKAAEAHPDFGGGESEMQRLNQAYTAAKNELLQPRAIEVGP